ncbi:MAG: hypothetical protein ACI35Q_11385 [Marinilabiliaceae bacterium]
MEEQPYIQLHIETQTPVSLSNLAEALRGFNRSYASFARQTDGVPSQLIVKEVNKGSIILDLTSDAVALFPAILDFIPHVKKLWDSLAKSDNDSDSLSIKELKEVRGVAGLVKTGGGGDISINTYSGDRQVINTFVISGEDGQRILEDISRRITPDGGEVVRPKQLLYIHQLSKGDNRSGCRGIIDAISPKPLRLVFDGATKGHIIDSDGNPFRRAHIVDVIVQTISGRAACYKVTTWYESIDLEDS